MWAEIDDAGLWRCFDCDAVITVNGTRTCKSNCDVAEMMADSIAILDAEDSAEYERAAIQAESDYLASKKRAKKVNKAKQQKPPLKNKSEDVAPF